ncbi:ferritin [Methanomicrobiaceae archaeon CYW5]|uniref:ferritin n=1 Tax=Methanovulcanius yangii TaxID=1789227 RepID=UPI0029CA3D4F|nr:ferritin [Methanovulcanius yangii]MBT8507178.1 ferritin [Methanovulcanius yangii]
MNDRVMDAINEQIKWELYSAYLYLSMSSWFESIGLKGFANWERIQAMEERDHAMKFYTYVLSRGGRVIFQSIDAPPSEWESPLAAYEFQLSHEKTVTARIENLMNIAIEEKDHASASMLQWFINEQVEEEENAKSIVDQLKLVSGETGKGLLYMLDKDLAARVYHPPVVQE